MVCKGIGRGRREQGQCDVVVGQLSGDDKRRCETSRGGEEPSADVGPGGAPPSSVELTVIRPGHARQVALKRGEGKPATRTGNNTEMGASRVTTKDHSLVNGCVDSRRRGEMGR